VYQPYPTLSASEKIAMADTDSPLASNGSDRSWQPSVLLSLVAATLGGAVGFLILYKLHPFFPRPELPEMPQYPSEELRALYRDAELNFHFKNGAFDFAILGALLGLLFGLFTGRSSKRILSAIFGMVLGVIAGGLAGGGIGYRVATDINNSTQQTLLLSSLYHFTLWAAIGIFVFAALAVCNDLKQMGSVVISGVLAGIFASLAYNVVSSIMFPTANLSLITPDPTTQRIVWMASGCLSLGLCLGLGFRKSNAAPDTVAS
jgi:MFS family permease